MEDEPTSSIMASQLPSSSSEVGIGKDRSNGVTNKQKNDPVVSSKRSKRKKISTTGSTEMKALWAELGLDDSSDEEVDVAVADKSSTFIDSCKREYDDSDTHEVQEEEHKGFVVPSKIGASAKKDIGINTQSSGGKANVRVKVKVKRDSRKISLSPSNNSERSSKDTPAKSSARSQASINDKKSTHKSSGVTSSRVYGKGDKVYAAWWPENDVERSTPPLWYSGTIKGYKTLDNKARLYNVTFDDGDKIGNLKEEHIMTKEEYDMKMKKEIKPLFDKGDEVYAAFWPDDKRSASTPSWYPGKIKSYREVKGDGRGEYGPTRFYDVV